jgi:hypothetical protein
MRGRESVGGEKEKGEALEVKRIKVHFLYIYTYM